MQILKGFEKVIKRNIMCIFLNHAIEQTYNYSDVVITGVIPKYFILFCVLHPYSLDSQCVSVFLTLPLNILKCIHGLSL